MNSDKDNSWTIARDTAKNIGYVPIAFAQAIRMLVSDHIKNNGQIRAVTKYQISRLFRGASFKSTIYFATQELKGDFLKDNSACTVGDLVSLYSPLDLASFITCFFLNRQMKKIGKEKWDEIAPYFSKESSIGALVGLALPKVGFGPGLIIAALRNVSHGLLSFNKPETYKKYREQINKENKISDDKLELQIWGTTSSQVTSLVLTNIGFIGELVELLGTATSTTTPISRMNDQRLINFRLGYIWQEAFLLKRQDPLEKFNTEHYPLKENRAKAQVYVDKAIAGNISWLDRGKDDLIPEKAPHLFAKKKEDPNLEIPDELKDVFSIEELTKMNEDDFDALIDQIDEEQKSSSQREDVISSKSLLELESQVG